MRYRELIRDSAITVTEQSEPYLVPAIRHNGKIYRAPRGSTSHYDALALVPPDQRGRATLDGDNRLFATGTGRVLGRQAAQRYALANDLIRADAPSYAKTSPELIAEFLRS